MSPWSKSTKVRSAQDEEPAARVQLISSLSCVTQSGLMLFHYQKDKVSPGSSGQEEGRQGEGTVLGTVDGQEEGTVDRKRAQYQEPQM